MSWEDKVRKVVPYVAGEQPKDRTVIKLNTNECPYPPAPGVAQVLEELSQKGSYERNRLYPDMDATKLVNALAAKYEVSPEQIFVGVGSDDVLAMSFLTFFTNGRPILFPDITYSFYDVWASLFRIPYIQVPLRDDFSINPEDYIPAHCRANSRADSRMADEGFSGEISANLSADKSAEKSFTIHAPEGDRQTSAADMRDLGGIVFPNPNAPTGLELPFDQVERIIAANPDCVVIVDEAYVDFGGTTVLPLLEKYDNLLVTRTFSKSRAMAGARIGYAIGNPKLIRYLKDVKFSFNSYTMNLEAIEIGTAAVEDDAYFREITGKIIRTREKFKKELAEMGFTFPDSHTNFVFAKPPVDKMSAREMFAKLREKKIIVRYFDKPRIDGYLRITIGTDEQMEAVARAMREILA